MNYVEASRSVSWQHGRCLCLWCCIGVLQRDAYAKHTQIAVNAMTLSPSNRLPEIGEW